MKLRKYYLSVFSNRVFSFSILNLQHVESKTLSSDSRLFEILSKSIRINPSRLRSNLRDPLLRVRCRSYLKGDYNPEKVWPHHMELLRSLEKTKGTEQT